MLHFHMIQYTKFNMNIVSMRRDCFFFKKIDTQHVVIQLFIVGVTSVYEEYDYYCMIMIVLCRGFTRTKTHSCK